MTRTKSRGPAHARRRGKVFEQKVAKLVGGLIHPGLDGDVWALDADGNRWMYEAKHRTGLRLTRPDELWHFMSQITRYATNNWQPDQKWALVISGGIHAKFPKLSKSGTFVLVSMEEYMRLRDAPIKS